MNHPSPKTLERMVRVMLDDPTLTDAVIRERFGVSAATVSEARKKYGIQRIRHVMGVRRGKR